ncbi:hypothetical protein [uncultured Ruthenibacterium sp.]
MDEKIKKTIIFEKDLHDKITELAKESERDFTKQVKFMLRQYLEIQKK